MSVMGGGSPFVTPAGLEGRIGNMQSRIRTLEALVATGGSDPTVCPDCVLQPYTVVPGAISIPEPYRECVDVEPKVYDFDEVCGSSTNVLLFGPLYAGPGGNWLSGFRPRVEFLSVAGNPLGNSVENFQVFLYQGPDMGSLTPTGWGWARTFDPPYPASELFHAVNVVCEDCPASPDCADVLAIQGFFAPNNTVFGSCRGGGQVVISWYYDPDDTGFRGALDDLPPGEAFGDTLYFDPDTGDIWKAGARSIPSRAISFFNG